MSSRLMAPKVGSSAAMVSISLAGSRCSISMSNTSMPANFLNSTALPSMTGLAANGPIAPRPSTAVPFDITPTRLPRPRVPIGIERVACDGFAGRGDARAVGQRQVPLREQLLGGRDRELSGCRVLVIIQRRLGERLLVGCRHLPSFARWPQTGHCIADRISFRRAFESGLAMQDLVSEIETAGFAIVKGFLTPAETEEISREVDRIYAEGLKHHASYRDHNLLFEVLNDPKANPPRGVAGPLDGLDQSAHGAHAAHAPVLQRARAVPRRRHPPNLPSSALEAARSQVHLLSLSTRTRAFARATSRSSITRAARSPPASPSTVRRSRTARCA